MVFQKKTDEDDVESGANEDFARLLEESFKGSRKRLNPGDRVRGEVLSLGREHVIVSTGTPYDGLVPREDLLDVAGQPRVKVGEFVDLFVTQIRGTQTYLSPNPTAKNLADDLEDAYRRDLVVEGKVEELQNGGFRVTLMGKRAFCPVSQIDLKYVEKPEEYLEKRFDFKITQYSERGRNIVVSRRRLLEEQKGHAQLAFLEQKNPGDTVEGTVSRLEKFGAFVEIAPGLEGLAHISELSWSRVNEPGEVLELGQHVSAKILKIEREGERMKISLSLKQVQAEPWLNLPPEIQEGRVLPGRVTRCLKFGAFVELYPGIEGLIPLSEMSYTKRVVNAEELVKPGERINVKVKEVDAFARRISLSLRDAEGGDPWNEVADKFKVGSIVAGTVERREPYGLFVRIADGITGLLPKSKAFDNPEFGFERLRLGDSVKVRIGELKASERRISLEVPKEDGSEDWQAHVAGKSAAASGGGGSLGVLGNKLQAALEKKNKK
jgi:small subunit ribosomal protein S1